jgi:primosomal protein N'
MRFYEVLVADAKYKSGAPLTYSSEDALDILNVVSVPLRARTATGFVISETGRPSFAVKPIKALVSQRPLPYHCLQLAQWIENYYAANLSEVLRQIAHTKPEVRGIQTAKEAGLNA